MATVRICSIEVVHDSPYFSWKDSSRYYKLSKVKTKDNEMETSIEIMMISLSDGDDFFEKHNESLLKNGIYALHKRWEKWLTWEKWLIWNRFENKPQFATIPWEYPDEPSPFIRTSSLELMSMAIKNLKWEYMHAWSSGT